MGARDVTRRSPQLLSVKRMVKRLRGREASTRADCALGGLIVIRSLRICAPHAELGEMVTQESFSSIDLSVVSIAAR